MNSPVGLLAFLLAAFLSAGALAQSPGNDARGSTPPGTSNDGGRPSDGAITGGSILPGERGGVPDGASSAPKIKGEQRCMQLTGVLREQCLQDVRGSSAGASRAPGLPPREGPSTAPPPTNLR